MARERTHRRPRRLRTLNQIFPFAADKLTEPLLKKCSEYLKLLPEIDTSVLHNMYMGKIQSLCGEEYFPFLKTIACKNHNAIFDIEPSNQLEIDTSYSQVLST